MREKWTGRLIGDLHIHNVTIKELADFMGITNSYATMVLNCKRTPEGAQERFETALREYLVLREQNA